jgi:hypothetical protein
MIIADTTKHRGQLVDLWIISEQKSIKTKRVVYETASGAYITFEGCVVYVRGKAGSTWHGTTY